MYAPVRKLNVRWIALKIIALLLFENNLPPNLTDRINKERQTNKTPLAEENILF